MPTAQIAVPEAGPWAAVRSLLLSTLRLTEGDRLVVAFGAEHATPAAWLATAARADGVAARLLGAADWAVPRLGVRIGEAFTALGGGDGTEAVVLLGGLPLDPLALALPTGVLAVQLPDPYGTGDPSAGPRDADAGAGPSPLDALAPRGDRLAALRDRLAAEGGVTLTTGQDGALRLTAPDADAVRVEETPPEPGRLRIAPLGRVAVTGAALDGTFTADAALRVNRRTRLGTALAGRPVRLTLAGGLVTALECPGDPLLERFLRRAVATHRVHAARTLLARPDTVTLRLTADPGDAYSTASADLRIDLTAHATPSAERN